MAIKLMYITNKPEIAQLAEACGVDRIFVDLELLNKEARQGNLNAVISRHVPEDISRIREVLTKAELLVRVDPIHQDSKAQIDAVISRGADIVMLPMFTSVSEVQTFISIVGGRARTMLLLETPQAMVRIDDILEVPGVDEIHIGLNDLHLGMKLDFMFELLSGGIVEYLMNKIRAKGIPCGFGGIARIGYGMLPAERILCEHFRLGSSMVILSRSFCDAYKMSAQEVGEAFSVGVKKIREFEEELPNYAPEQFARNMTEMKRIVGDIVKEKTVG